MKKTPKAISDAMADLGRKSWKARKRRMLEKAKQNAEKLRTVDERTKGEVK